MIEQIDCREMVLKLVTDLLKNPTEGASKSYLDCHARGVHSVYLGDVGEPYGVMRMFYATKIHDLARNKDVFDGKPACLSVGAHPHRRDIILMGMFGAFTNHNVRLDGNGKIQLQRYEYTSLIKDGECSFVAQGVPLKFSTKDEIVTGGSAVRLSSRMLHTVSVEPGKEAGWLVAEGDVDPRYSNSCYSNDDLTKFSADGMYKVPSVPIYCELLRQTAKRLMETAAPDR